MRMYEITMKPEESTGQWEDFFKVLSDETRLRILMLLSQRELCVCEICQVLDLPQPKISRHLAKMRDLNFVIDKKEGQWTFYYLSIEDPLFISITQQLATNSNDHAVIRNDMERLTEKESSGAMCQRTERITVQVGNRK
jgi:ArsR family transcriptional regulator